MILVCFCLERKRRKNPSNISQTIGEKEAQDEHKNIICLFDASPDELDGKKFMFATPHT
jgi:hypothetical protein